MHEQSVLLVKLRISGCCLEVGRITKQSILFEEFKGFDPIVRGSNLLPKKNPTCCLEATLRFKLPKSLTLLAREREAPDR